MSTTNNDININLPWWATTIIVLLGIIGIGLALWGFLSAFKVNSNKKTKEVSLIKHLKGKKRFTINNISENLSGIFLLTFKDINFDEFFRPIYFFMSTNLLADIEKIKKELIENNEGKIYKYMKIKNLNLNEIVIIYVSEKQTNEEKVFWINLFETDQRGFN